MASPLPDRQPPAPSGQRPLAIQGGGHDRFGAIGGLQVYREQTLGLARFLAGQYGLAAVFEEGEPQVTVTATRYALALQEEMSLASERARRITERAVTDTARRRDGSQVTYSEAFASMVRSGDLEALDIKMDKLHRQTRQFRSELGELAAELAEREKQATAAEPPDASRRS